MAHCGDSETQTYGKRDDLQATVGFTMETKPNRRCKEDMKTRKKKKSKQTQNFFCFVFILFSLLTFCTFFFLLILGHPLLQPMIICYLMPFIDFPPLVIQVIFNVWFNISST